MNCCTEINFSEKEAEELLQQTKNPEIKGELMKTTEGAVERGAFGAPTMFVGDEMYFGSDRFHFMFPGLFFAVVGGLVVVVVVVVVRFYLFIFIYLLIYLFIYQLWGLTGKALTLLLQNCKD